MAIDDIHTPVLLERCIELLAPAVSDEGAVLIDATLGMAGHAEAMLERFPQLTLIGLDRDLDALDIAQERLERFGSRARFVKAVYDDIDEAAEELGFPQVDGILFDLGVSSLQLDRTERGFSYSQDAPLDMRMDASSELTAETILATYDEVALRKIFWEYGDEKLAQRYARRIVEERQQRPLTSSGQLVELIDRATPAAARRTGHPAKRVFQALRIEVNAELSVLESAVPRALDLLRVGGRIVFLSYQSLEDRIVKRELQARAKSTTPAGLPVELPEHSAELKLLVKGAELATEAEIDENPRAKPVRLRAAERLRRPA
ncbi:16S rRNA (cytosine(1402)-N(4))-methyltransferase [Plantibacter flavus]|uniref:16S rRNA (cytosine(1402)-N(4))-methyltransferase RsmH n=1 Tax=Plantibacter flavus TaxID=150123 RepID=UPI00099CCD05|nr:16S rRNA (cytosine(1402)-N(4))-methyltransferase RsmH [Plantibacter flavus]AQX80425.1 16S rRNA (cytosine(1402)-N(4))-methyltransferase [Plantibacter flavus]